MKKPHLYLHIGTHKTGSTAIQKALQHNRHLLKKDGFIYLPLPGCVRSLASSRELDKKFTHSFKEEINRHIKKHRKGNLCFLMSWEGFSGDPATGYNDTDIIAKHLKEATAHIHVTIVVYLRRQDDFIESMYTQEIHEGGSIPFKEFINSYPKKPFDWNQLLHHYSKHFGKDNILVRKYDRASLPKKNSLLEDFSTAIGLSGKYLAKTEVTLTPNCGYSRDALEIAKLCNPHLNNEERSFLRRMLQKTSSKQPFEAYSFWTQTEREQFLSQYTASNCLVVENYFNNLSCELFSPPKRDPNAPRYEGLSLETAALTLIKAACPPPKQTLFGNLKNAMRKKHYS